MVCVVALAMVLVRICIALSDLQDLCAAGFNTTFDRENGESRDEIPRSTRIDNCKNKEFVQVRRRLTGVP